MTVSEAVASELAQLEPRLAGASSSPLAAAAMVLAGELDSAGTSATAKALCARAMRECLDRLWERVPAAEESNPLDDLRARRAARGRESAA